MDVRYRAANGNRRESTHQDDLESAPGCAGMRSPETGAVLTKRAEKSMKRNPLGGALRAIHPGDFG